MTQSEGAGVGPGRWAPYYAAYYGDEPPELPEILLDKPDSTMAPPALRTSVRLWAADLALRATGLVVAFVLVIAAGALVDRKLRDTMPASEQWIIERFETAFTMTIVAAAVLFTLLTLFRVWLLFKLRSGSVWARRTLTISALVRTTLAVSGLWFFGAWMSPVSWLSTAVVLTMVLSATVLMYQRETNDFVRGRAWR